MGHVFERKVYEQFDEWKDSLSFKKKALVVRGLRGIGKTAAVLDFAKRSYKHVIHIDFEKDRRIKKAFDGDLTMDVLVSKITALRPDARFVPGKAVLVFDEVQDCARARQAIKPIMLDGRYDVIATGSLLNIYGYNRKKDASVPVGFEYSVHMYPMDFEEYLWAKGISKDLIAGLKKCLASKTMVDPFINSTFIEHFREFIAVGGMPEAVASFMKYRDFNRVRRIHSSLMDTFADDFGKHLDENEVPKIDNLATAKVSDLLSNVPEQLGKEGGSFSLRSFNKNARMREYGPYIRFLVDYGLVRIANNLSTPELPLSTYARDESFKLYLADTGLLLSKYDDNPYQGIIDGDFGINKGAIYENVVATALVSKGKPLYYFSKDSRLEVDFVTTLGGKLSLLEVKAGNNPSRSLNKIARERELYPSVKSFYRLVEGNVGEMDGIVTLPIYMSAFLE